MTIEEDVLTPTIRLILRALLVGGGVVIEQLQASATWDATVIRAAIVAGALAALEFFTPLNAVVGPGKTGTPPVPEPKA